MQSFKRRLKTAAFSSFMAFLFMFGILFAGADFNGFPWVNLIGALMLGLFSLIGNRLSE